MESLLPESSNAYLYNLFKTSYLYLEDRFHSYLHIGFCSCSSAKSLDLEWDLYGWSLSFVVLDHFGVLITTVCLFCSSICYLLVDTMCSWTFTGKFASYYTLVRGTPCFYVHEVWSEYTACTHLCQFSAFEWGRPANKTKKGRSHMACLGPFCVNLCCFLSE